MEFFDFAGTVDEAVGIVPRVVWVHGNAFSAYDEYKKLS